MALIVLDPYVEQRLKAERQASDAYRYDEVWDGVYVLGVPADTQHQDLQAGLGAAIQNALGWDHPARLHTGANVSDRRDDWEFNYRCPDVVVVLPGGSARDCGTHWCGGPDFCAEIVSTHDRSRDKLDFYGAIGVSELLLIDRDPWALELYHLSGGRLESVGTSDLGKPEALASTVLPVSFRLTAGTKRPKIEVVHRDGAQRWLV